MANQDKYFSTTIFGVRLEGRDGWLVDAAPCEIEKIEGRLREAGYKVLEVRSISTGISRRWDENGEPVVDGPPEPLMRERGWTYDKAAECWRAPDETILEPAGEPAVVKDFFVVGTAPEAGWWRVAVTADGRQVNIHFSNVFDPIGGVLDWLEEIVEGKSATVVVDQEGSYTDLICFPRGDGWVRLMLRQDLRREPEIDALVERRALVGEWYRAIRVLCADGGFRTEWRRPDEYEDIMEGRVRSARVEEYLSSSA
jgi:hypothetical protein